MTSETCAESVTPTEQMSDSNVMGNHNMADCQADHISCESSCTASSCHGNVLYEKQASGYIQFHRLTRHVSVTSITVDGFATIIYHPPITTS